MNWFEYLPSILAIYLIAISYFSSRYLRSIVQTMLSGRQGFDEQNINFIQNVALDWADRVNFIAGMTLAIISVFVILSNPDFYAYAVLIVFIILLVFILMLFWVLSFPIGDMISTRVNIRGHIINLSPSGITKITLILVNIVLIIIICISQYSTS